jgi:hypothetical protein
VVAKLLNSGNSVLVSPTRAVVRRPKLEKGSGITASLDKEQGVLAAKPATEALSGLDREFSRQVADFIEEYRLALEALASGGPDGC